MTSVDTEPVWKESGTLADGREIVYFDEQPGLGRALEPDSRSLPPVPSLPFLPLDRPIRGIVPIRGVVRTREVGCLRRVWWMRRTRRMPEAKRAGMRWDPLAGEWVLVAAARQDRTFLPPADQCPLDPSSAGRPTEIPAASYDVVSFENRFPSLRAPHGRCEVMCFTSDHLASFASLSPRRVRTIVEAWADRTAVLSELPGIEQVYCFENRGEEIGVTLRHPHGQIYALPFVTPRTQQMVAQALAYRGGNLFDDMVSDELTADVRIITRNEHWTAFVPRAARWPYEVRIFPVTRVPDLPRSARRRAGSSGRCTWTCCGGSTPCLTHPRRISRRGIRLRSGTRPRASNSRPIFRYCRCDGRPAS